MSGCSFGLTANSVGQMVYFQKMTRLVFVGCCALGKMDETVPGFVCKKNKNLRKSLTSPSGSLLLLFLHGFI